MKKTGAPTLTRILHLGQVLVFALTQSLRMVSARNNSSQALLLRVTTKVEGLDVRAPQSDAKLWQG